MFPVFLILQLLSITTSVVSVPTPNVLTEIPDDFWTGHKVTYVNLDKRSDNFAGPQLYAWAVEADHGEVLQFSNGTTFRRIGAPVKRQYPGACQNVELTEDEVVKTEKYWGNWTSASTCGWCGDSATECLRRLQYSKSTSRTLSVGITAGMANAAGDRINAKAELNFGYQWKEEKTWSDTFECKIPARSWRSTLCFCSFFRLVPMG